MRAMRLHVGPMFDSWTHDDFAQHVYNADYPRHDPEYLEIRPQQHADLISHQLSEMREGRVLDFGSGWACWNGSWHRAASRT